MPLHHGVMVVHVRLRAFLRLALLHVGSLALIAYFGFHAFSGNYGITAQRHYEETKRSLEADLERITAERVALEARTALLRSAALDPDILDEKARRTLGLVHENDVVLLRSR